MGHNRYVAHGNSMRTALFVRPRQNCLPGLMELFHYLLHISNRDVSSLGYLFGAQLRIALPFLDDKRLLVCSFQLTLLAPAACPLQSKTPEWRADGYNTRL